MLVNNKNIERGEKHNRNAHYRDSMRQNLKAVNYDCSKLKKERQQGARRTPTFSYFLFLVSLHDCFWH